MNMLNICDKNKSLCIGDFLNFLLIRDCDCLKIYIFVIKEQFGYLIKKKSLMVIFFTHELDPHLHCRHHHHHQMMECNRALGTSLLLA